ncbi:MAG TPA: histidinol-phosphate transaminase [Stellaceae bacterium]|jgi:histidinol-phosphate aminotransferase|nr:histidinol-phosphate transaminase [Stellaceae bacterium]
MASKSHLIPQPGILDIGPYVGGEAKAPGFERPIRLASNESALGPSAKVIAAYHAHADDIFRYPDGHSTALRAAIGKLHGIDPARIVCGGGSDDVIDLLTAAYAGPGDEMLYGRHGFSLYPIAARTAGAKPIEVPEKNLTFDVDATLARVTPKTRLVFVANPNNPTGTFITRDEMKRLHTGLPKSVLLVIDAAYAEFVTRDDYEPGLELATNEPNVVMTRTFSKIYALGGMRIGWAYGSAEIAGVLNRIRSPFNVSSAAQVCGVAAVEDIAAVERAREHNSIWHPWLTRELEALGLALTPSVANFVLARFPKGAPQADAAWDYLRERGILVRKVAVYHLPEYLRITIGKEHEMRAVVDALKEFLRQA